MPYFLRTSVRPSLSRLIQNATATPQDFDFNTFVRRAVEENTEARLDDEDLGVDFDLGELTLPLEADPPALSSTLHPLSALPSVYPTAITTSTGSVNPSYNTPASNVPSPTNSISPPAGSVNPLSDTPTSIPPSTVPSTSNPTVESPAASNKRKNARSHDKRAKIRRIRKEEKAGPSSNTYANVLSHGTAIEVEADATHFPAAKGAVTGKKGTLDELGDAIDRQKFYTVVELVNEHGFEHIAWDGKKPYPIIDRVGRVIAVLAGQPNNTDYAKVLMQAHDEMKDEGMKAGLGMLSPEGKHIRGVFPAYNCGTTMGMGSPRPVVMDPKGRRPLLTHLLNNEGVIRMARYQNFAFSLWAPRVYAEYVRVRDTVRSTLHLPENFYGVSVFAAAAFNFGGRVSTFKHRDSLNWAFGWCAITALGRFDATRSAQLILWELKLVVDFPHASTVLIPSAVVTHSNTPVAEGDDRGSFTQYTAGPIFRWVDNGCRTEKEVKEQDPQHYDLMQSGKETAYLKRVANFSTIEELCNLVE